MSSIFLFVMMGLGGQPGYEGSTAAQQTSSAQQVSAQPQAVQTPPAPVRSAGELRKAVHEALRKWVHPADSVADRAAREFLALYQEVLHHPQLAHESQKEMLLTLRSRLRSLAQQIAARNAHSQPLAADAPKSVTVPEGAKLPLAQMGGQAGVGGNPAGGQANDNSMVYDAGQDLVDLIQKTISPTTWDVNGGPGSIVYWRAGNCLVVRQTQEIHEAMGGLIDQLGRAGH
jgi:hypothetical protein